MLVTPFSIGFSLSLAWTEIQQLLGISTESGLSGSSRLENSTLPVTSCVLKRGKTNILPSSFLFVFLLLLCFYNTFKSSLASVFLVAGFFLNKNKYCVQQYSLKIEMKRQKPNTWECTTTKCFFYLSPFKSEILAFNPRYGIYLMVMCVPCLFPLFYPFASVL